MEFTVHRADLLAALSRVLGAIDKRNTLPVLSHVLVIARLRGALEVVATDLEIFAIAECPAGLPGSGGEVCVPAEKLRGALEAISDASVTVVIDGMKMVIDTGDRRFELACLPVEEFPAVPGCAGTERVIATFQPEVLPRMLRAVAHAASQDTVAKSHMCGVHLRNESGRLTAISTDGHRLSLAGLTLDGAEALNKGITLPIKACRVLTGITATLEMSRPEDNLIHFEGSNAWIFSRLFDRDFPEFRRVIPTDCFGSLTVDRLGLSDALAACGVVSEDRSKSVDLDCDGERLTVSALGPQGTAGASVPCAGGEGLRIKLPSTQLLQALKALDGDEVFIKHKHRRPLLILPVDHGPWDERLELIMPLGV